MDRFGGFYSITLCITVKTEDHLLANQFYSYIQYKCQNDLHFVQVIFITEHD